MTWFTVVVAVSIVVVGCDDPVPVIAPPMPATAPAEPAAPARPTTQSLLTGPRTRTPLAPLPLALQLPPGWSLVTAAGMPVLNGPAPSGDLTVLLISRNVPTASVALTERGAKDEAAANRSTRPLAEARTVNGVRLFERQSVGTRLTPDGSPTFNWLITVYGPADADSETTPTYELNVMGLSRAGYESDKAFLYSILDSVELVAK